MGIIFGHVAYIVFFSAGNFQKAPIQNSNQFEKKPAFGGEQTNKG